MKTNVGTLDRVIRVIAGLVVMWAVFYIPMSVAWTWALTVVGLVLIVTGLCGSCLIYTLFNIDTGKK